MQNLAHEKILNILKKNDFPIKVQQILSIFCRQCSFSLLYNTPFISKKFNFEHFLFLKF